MNANRWLCRLGVVAMVLAIATPSAAQKRYPNWGEVEYNGDRTVSFWMFWEIPGGWTVRDPGYEHNLAIDTAYYNTCTSWSELPYAYDDCATSGTSEVDPNRISFAFGSYHIIVDQCCNAATRHGGYHPAVYDPPIQSSTWYYGDITLSCSGGGSCYAYSTKADVYAQEVDRNLCPFPPCSDYEWHMGGTIGGGSNGLVSGTFVYGQVWYTEYMYDPVTGERVSER